MLVAEDEAYLAELIADGLQYQSNAADVAYDGA